MIEEMGEEITQYPLGGLSKKATYDSSVPYFSMNGEAIINPKEMAYSAGGVAGITSGAMGGGGALVNQAFNRMANAPTQPTTQPIQPTTEQATQGVVGRSTPVNTEAVIQRAIDNQNSVIEDLQIQNQPQPEVKPLEPVNEQNNVNTNPQLESPQEEQTGTAETQIAEETPQTIKEVPQAKRYYRTTNRE